MDGITKTKRNINSNRPTRPAEKEANARALPAARYILENPLNRPAACDKFTTTRSGITLALVLLQEGTPEEIAAVDAGAPLNPIVATIRKRRTALAPGKRQRLKKVAYSQVELERKKVDMAIWEHLGSALKSIASLPQPDDVVKIARKNGERTKAVDRNLMTAFSWITEFSDAWTK